MAQLAFDEAFLERSERYKGTRRAEAAVDLVRNALILAAQRDQRHLDRLRGTIARSPLLFAAVQSDRLDPLLVAALAGDGFMRDVAGHPPRGGERVLTAFDLIARDAMSRHVERCSSSPDAAARLESCWASNRSSVRDGYLSAPLRALEQTYGAACQSLIDARCGHAPLHAPPSGWQPGPVAARLADPLRVAPVAGRLRAAARAHALPAEWIPPSQVRRPTSWWRTRWQASGASRAQQLERRSGLRVPVSRWLFRRGMRRALESGPDATASYLRRVAANPRRVAAARAEGLDPLVVAAALGPAQLRDHVHGRPLTGRTNLDRLYASLSEARERRLGDAALRARGAGAADGLAGVRTPADAEFAGLYDSVVGPQARAAGLVPPRGGLAARSHALEDAWVAHHARADASEAPPLVWGRCADYADTGPYGGVRPPSAASDPAAMSLDELVRQRAAAPEAPAAVSPAAVPSPLVPPIPRTPPAPPADEGPVRARVSDPVPAQLDGRTLLVVTVPPEVVTADAVTPLEDPPAVTLNPDGSYTVHDLPPVERVVPQPGGSYRVYMTDDPPSDRPPRSAASTAERAERTRAADPAEREAPAAAPADAPPAVVVAADRPPPHPQSRHDPAAAAARADSAGITGTFELTVPAAQARPLAPVPGPQPVFALQADGSWKVHGDPEVDVVRPKPDGSCGVRFHPHTVATPEAAQWAAGRVQDARDRGLARTQPAAPVARPAPVAPPVVVPAPPEPPEPRSRDEVDLDFAARFGELLSERLRSGDSVIEPPPRDAPPGSARAGLAGGRAEPVVIGETDVVTVAGPAAFALGIDAADRAAGASGVRPLYVSAARLRAAGAEPPAGVDPVSVPDPWGGPGDVALYPVDRLPSELAGALPGMPAAPPYDRDSEAAPAYQHFIAGAVHVSGVKAVRELGPDPTATPAFTSRDGGTLALFPAKSVAAMMHDAAEGGGADATRKRVDRQTASHSANLRACAEAVADRLAADAEPPMPAADRALAARLGVWQLAQRTRAPHVSDAPAKPADPDADPGVRGQWDDAARDPQRMRAVLRTAAGVSDTMLREAFAARDRDRSDGRQPEAPDPNERPLHPTLPPPAERREPARDGQSR